MAKYMLLLGGGDDSDLGYEEVKRKYEQWTESLIQAGKFVGAHKLRDEEGRRLRFDGERVIDGPFTETKETVGGYYLLEAADYAEASRLAGECPILRLQSGWVEVREVEL